MGRLFPNSLKNTQYPKVRKEVETRGRRKSQRVNGVTPLQLWYEEIMKSEDKQCWNCGISLSGYNKQDWHACIAHVLPKSQFPSVATHPLNYMILGKWCNCHGTYDSNWGAASRMPIFKEAMQRFIILEPDIKEKSKIPSIFQI
jgi:diadenosine tetraphosphatase ApaH/serine/threonine PP2A family protein phosphatase